jgi:CRISPR-associated protein Cas1
MRDEHNLLEGWFRVRQNAGRSGTDGVSITQFGKQVFRNLSLLAARVREDRYAPQPLLQLRIPKEEEGKFRLLAIPTVADRVLQSSACRVLEPVLEPQFEKSSYGYRPAHSVRMAVSAITRMRDDGYRWVVDADIQSFFDEIDHAHLLAELEKHVGDARLTQLIHGWVKARIKGADGHWITPERGIPQGAPISPLLANLYLDDLDEAIAAKGHKLVRFADDFIILCKSRGEADEALELTEEVINALALKLSLEKTQVTNFDDGFKFLGVQFLKQTLYAEPRAAPWVLPKPPQTAFRLESGPTLPPTLGAALEHAIAAQEGHAPEAAFPPHDPQPVPPSAKGEGEEWREESADSPPYLRTLHLLAPGLTLARVSERLAVARGRDRLREIPIHKLDQVFLSGNVFITSPALQLCAENRVSVHFADGRGVPYAQLASPECHDAQLRRRQYAMLDDTGGVLKLAQALVLAKIAGQRALLRRYFRNHPVANAEMRLAEMGYMADGAQGASDLDKLRGHEGMAARIYFGALDDLLPKAFGFQGRHAHPPTDPANAMLSYAYAVLYHNVNTLIQRRGLDPFVGYLHSLRDGHAALASDLMEPFRAPVADAVVLSLMLQKRVKPDGFGAGEGGVSLMEDGTKRLLIHALEKKLAQAGPGGLDWRRLIARDVVGLEKFLMGQAPAFGPFKP